jgi:hypothetical protein
MPKPTPGKGTDVLVIDIIGGDYEGPYCVPGLERAVEQIDPVGRSIRCYCPSTSIGSNFLHFLAALCAAFCVRAKPPCFQPPFFFLFFLARRLNAAPYRFE